MSARDRRLAENEAFFREVNERLDELAPDAASGLFAICECAYEDCTERITVSQADYEAVRAEPTHFIVVRGHADLSLEDVVRRTDHFDVVQKRGEAAAVAERLAGSREPRAD